MMNNTPPVLLLIFNRPSTTVQVFDAIRKAQPSQLFIGADGPRKDRNDEELCKKTRSIVAKVDWPCEVRTLFREDNLGAGKAVSEAVTWFFEHVEYGIILEDDCLPDMSFFEFCHLLLNKYANTKEVMSISGTNILPDGWKPETQSYHFAHGGVWGWATWRRAWKLYDFNMTDWDDIAIKDKIRNAIGGNKWYNYYLEMFEATYEKKLDAWDLQWFYCILINDAVAINPSVNLVRNIGFGPGATNTIETDGPYSNMLTGQMKFPLKHPARIEFDKQYLNAIYKLIFWYNKSLTSALKQWVKKKARKKLDK